MIKESQCLQDAKGVETIRTLTASTEDVALLVGSLREDIGGLHDLQELATALDKARLAVRRSHQTCYVMITIVPD